MRASEKTPSSIVQSTGHNIRHDAQNVPSVSFKQSYISWTKDNLDNLHLFCANQLKAPRTTLINLRYINVLYRSITLQPHLHRQLGQYQGFSARFALRITY